jgi:putative methylase
MRKRKLEMLLEQVRGFESPEVAREQYATPATVAAELLYFAHMNGDLRGSVLDLGCGTGVLAIGASLLQQSFDLLALENQLAQEKQRAREKIAENGATQKVIGIDSDIRALETAKANARSLGAHVEWICCDVRDVCGQFDAVVMNPPFGAQEKGNDRPFLDKALEVGRVIYSIHNAGSQGFIERYIRGRGTVTDVVPLKFPIRHTFKFHKREVAFIDVELYRIQR